MQPANELTCKELVELVTDYLEGALSEADRRRFEAHIAGCSGCRNYLGQMQQTISTLGKLAEEHIDPVAKEDLLSIFRNWRG